MKEVKDDEVGEGGPDTGALRPGPRTLIEGAAWFGLVAGWLELAGLQLQRIIDPRIWMDSLRTNDHFVWMMPLSNMLLFTAVGLVLAILARNRPRVAHQIGWRVLATLAVVAVALTVNGLALIASIILACGIGAVTGRFINGRRDRFTRLARLTLPILAAPVFLIAIVWMAHQSMAERFALSRLPTARSATPNVLFIVLDNVRASSLSLYGHTRPTSPNLERLAKRGFVFDAARATAPWTLASHASMFTGQWCSRLSLGWHRPLDDANPTLAEYLAGHGYAAAGFVGNTFYCNSRYGLDRGFSRYEDYYENRRISLFEVIHSASLGRALLWCLRYNINVEEGGNALRKTAAMLNRDVLGWLDSRHADRPFFVFLNYFDAHSPFIPPDGPGPRFGLCALGPDEKVEVLKRNKRLMEQCSLPGDGPPERIKRDALGVLVDSYESCIASLDHQLGQLFDQLDDRGLRENTLVIITSDHGEHFNERGFLGHGMSVYSREVHVPLVVIPPANREIGAGSIKTPVSLRELPATVVDLLGLQAGTPFPGQSLARHWQSGTQAPAHASPVLSEVEELSGSPASRDTPLSTGTSRALVAAGKVYIRAKDGHEELYDLAHDPFETRNLLEGENPYPVEQFRGLLSRLLQDGVAVETASADRRGMPSLATD